MNPTDRTRRFEGIVVWLGALPFIAAFLIHYPPIWTYMDENIYIGLAHTLRKGALFPDQVQISVPFSVWNGRHSVSQYPLGMPVLIALFSMLGWKAIFLANVSVLLIGFFFFIRWLRSEKLHPAFSWLYLYYPAVVFYSRTVMSDVSCFALATIASFYFSKQRLFLAGFLIGAAAQFRNTMLLIFAGMFLGLLGLSTSLRKKISDVLRLLLGVAPGIVLLAAYNSMTTGNPFLTPYSLTKGQPLSILFAPKNLFLFAESLFFMYPLMGLVLFRRCKRKHLFLFLGCWVFLLFHLVVPTDWIVGNQWGEPFQALLLQHRYLLPIIPLLLLFYAHAFTEAVERVRFSVGRCLLFLLPFLFFTTGLIHLHHQRYLRILAEFRQVVYNSIPERSCVVTNHDAMRLMNAIGGKRFVFPLLEPPGHQSRFLPTAVYYVKMTNPRAHRAEESGEFDLHKRRLISRVERNQIILEIWRMDDS